MLIFINAALSISFQDLEPILAHFINVHTVCVSHSFYRRIIYRSLALTPARAFHAFSVYVPLHLRRDALLPSFGMKADRKALLGNTASKIIWQHYHRHIALHRPVSVRSTNTRARNWMIRTSSCCLYLPSRKQTLHLLHPELHTREKC